MRCGDREGVGIGRSQADRGSHHRVLRRSIEAAEALADTHAGVIRVAGLELPVPRFSPQPPTRESTGAIAAMPFYAGQSVGAVRAVQRAAEIVAELAAGVTRVT